MKQFKFSKEGKFKILQFTDIHFSDNNEVDQETTKLMRKILQEETPDLIMITGDTVYGEDNAKFLPLALAPVIESQIPFSYTFGNHDTEDGEGYDALFSVLTQIPSCVVYHDERSKVGMGNHSLEIIDDNGNVKWAIVGMDSGNYNPLTHMEGYAYVQKP
ncbi:MAG: metallophosphoesterase, partial [Cellulosilyticaceae bacterium]